MPPPGTRPPPGELVPSTDPRAVRVRRAADGAEFNIAPHVAAEYWSLDEIRGAQGGAAQPPASSAAPALDDFVSGLAGAPAAPAAPVAPPPAPVTATEADQLAPFLTPQGRRDLVVEGPPAPAQAHTGPNPLPPRAPAPLPATVGAPVGQPRPGEVPISAQPPAPAAAPGAALPPVAAPAPRPRARRAPAAAPAPPTEEQLNAQTIDQLMGGPVMPQGERTSTPLEQQLERIGEGERLAREAAHSDAVAAAERQDVLELAQRQQQQLEAERNAAMATAERQYAQAVEEARAQTINPHRLLGSAGGMVGVAIATILGGLGAALTGGPNRGLETIQRAIDRDIAAQESNAQNARANVGASRTFLDITRQRFSDRGAAADAARALAWGQVAERAAAQAAQIRDEGAALRARELEAEARARAAAAQQAALIAQQDREIALSRELLEQRKLAAEAGLAERRAAGGGGSGRGRAPTEAMMNSYNRLVDSGITPEDAARQLRIAPPPGGRFAEHSSGDTSQAAGLLTAADSQLARVRSLIPERGQDIPGFGLFDGALPDLLAGDAGRALRQEIGSLVELYGRLHSGGAISDDEFRLFQRVIGAGRFRTEEELRRGLDLVEAEFRARRGQRPAAASSPAAAPAAPAANLPSGVTRR